MTHVCLVRFAIAGDLRVGTVVYRSGYCERLWRVESNTTCKDGTTDVLISAQRGAWGVGELPLTYRICKLSKLLVRAKNPDSFESLAWKEKYRMGGDGIYKELKLEGT